MASLTIHSEGGLIPPDILEAISRGDASGQQPADFGLAKSARPADEIAAAWADARGHWARFNKRLQEPRTDDTATTITRREWMLPLLLALDYDISSARSAVIDGSAYAISHRAGPDDDAPPIHTAAAERASEPARRLLKFERDLRAQIQKLSEQLDDTRRSLNILPENIQAVVEIALQLAGQPPLQPTTLDGIWPDPHGQRRTCPVFNVPPLHGSWARCCEGLAHPHTGVQRPITFDELVAHGRDDVVWAHLNHPLVQMSMRLLRAEVWSGQHNKRLQRVTARVVSRHVLAEPAIIAYARLVVIGGDKHRLHEEIIVAGGVIHEGRFRQLNIGQVHQALLAASDRQPSADAMSRMQALWPGLAPALIQALDARMKERTASLQSQLAERSRKEASDITAVLSELQRAIEAELRAPEAVQLPLFSSDEQEQYRRNLNALQRRLSQIPIEIQRETESVRARFANPEPRLFPVAVAFLVPEQIDM